MKSRRFYILRLARPRWQTAILNRVAELLRVLHTFLHASADAAIRVHDRLDTGVPKRPARAHSRLAPNVNRGDIVVGHEASVGRLRVEEMRQEGRFVARKTIAHGRDRVLDIGTNVAAVRALDVDAGPLRRTRRRC